MKLPLPKSFLTQLQIIQQEGYSPSRFLTWWKSHPLVFSVSTKKPLVFTQKAKILTSLSLLVFSLLVLSFILLKAYFLSIFVLSLFLFSPFIFLFIALLLMQPYEKINRFLTVKRIRQQILTHPHLTTIGITGSFGKTSVKDFLFHLISQEKSTLKTPESYNTVFGISKVVDFELLPKTQIFICEMGAYCRGEVAELCHMVPPDYAILTAIGTQHLERFKSIENTILAKFEIIDNCPNKSHCLANLDNPHIAKQLKLSQYHSVKTYSLINPAADFFVSTYLFGPSGISFTLKHKDKSYPFSSHLFGTSNLQNLVASISLSLLLKVTPQTIQNRLDSLQPSPHRLELKKIGQATLIDDAYSSNETGFTHIISDLSKLTGKKVLITPGIVELGIATASTHQKLGKLASSVFDEVILVGKSDRTENFHKGLRAGPVVSYIDNATNLWPIIDKLATKFDWILLEHDLPDNF